MILGSDRQQMGDSTLLRYEPVSPVVQKGTMMTTHARGTFDVTMTPQPPDDTVDNVPVGRMSLAKQFHGDLDATSTGQMLAVGTAVDGSAGYVAVEQVTGTLHGHSGAFALQHSGTMTRGTPQLAVTVVPDSGTAQLVGLVGTLTIDIVDGQHMYDFAYMLPASP